MADTQQATSQTDMSGISIPDETLKQFPDLIPLIQKSQSMNDEERQYWIDVLPIMTDDQISNLRNILDNEKKQIEEVNREYEQGVKEDAKYFNIQFDEFKYKEKKLMRDEAEKMHRLEEIKIKEKALAELAEL